MSQRGNRMGLGSKEWPSANGAVSTTDYHKFGGNSFITNATAALTLALTDGTHQGQLTFIKLKTKVTNNLVVTPANLGDGATLTFDATGEVCLLMWMGSNWEIIYNTSTLG